MQCPPRPGTTIQEAHIRHQHSAWAERRVRCACSLRCQPTLAGELHDEARALTFATLVLANLALIFTDRSWHRTVLGTLGSSNPALWWVVGGTVGFLALVVFLPSSRELFRFSVLQLSDWAVCFGVALSSILWFEVMKAWKAKRAAPKLMYRPATLL